jgi:hypothetical protein
MGLGGPPDANPSGRLPTPQAGANGTREMGFAAFSNGGEEVFLMESLFLKEKPAISDRKNGALFSVKKHAVPSVFSARNRSPARRKAS